ncbi:hypothetical protein JYU34_020234 [Plutella xylostella]|uniref:Uncharacterized protein n=1 Tax=Plutella xylostella TaxID=51655 RepID=A0ABQ7PU42_PLUXY|nr:hypothetical protein JYU34_020234 [Plutella xylostella]
MKNKITMTSTICIHKSKCEVKRVFRTHTHHTIQQRCSTTPRAASLAGLNKARASVGATRQPWPLTPYRYFYRAGQLILDVQAELSYSSAIN